MSRRRTSRRPASSRKASPGHDAQRPSRLGRATGTLAKVGGAATAVAAVATAVFLFFPGLQPKAHECSGTKTAKIVDPQWTGARFREYLDAVQANLHGHSAQELALRGFIVSYQVQTTGFSGKRLPLMYTLVDAKTRTEVRGHAHQLAIVVPQRACTDVVGQPIWVRPPNSKPYYVELSVSDDQGVVRDTKKSGIFSLASGVQTSKG